MSFFIRRFLNINYRQAPNFRLLALTFFVFIIGLVWAQTAILAELINVGLYPTAKQWSSILVIVFSLVYTTLVDSVKKDRMFIAITVLGILAIIPSSLLLSVDGLQNYGFISLWIIYDLLFYIWVIHWGTFVLEIYDSRIVKRIFPLLSAARPIGTIVSGISFRFLTEQLSFSTTGIVYLWLLTLVIVAVLLMIVSYRLNHVYKQSVRSSPFTTQLRGERSMLASIRDLWEGMDLVARSSFLRWMAISALAMVALNTLTTEFSGTLIIDYFRAQNVPDATKALAQITADWKSIGSVIALILQIFVFWRMMKIFGMRNIILAYPLLAVVASVGIVTLPVLLPLLVLAPAIYARETMDSLRRVFRDPVVGLLANAVPPNAKGRARAVINGLISPIGATLAASLLVMIPDTGNYIPSMLLLAAALYFVTAVALRQQYAQAMVSLLESQSYRFLLSQSQDIDVLESGAVNDTVVQNLVKQIREASDPQFQLFLWQLLCETGSEETLMLIREMLPEGDADFQAKLLKTYVEYGSLNRDSRDYLLDLIKAESAEIRKIALQGLSALYGSNDKQYIHIAHEILKNDPASEVQLQALQILLTQKRNKQYQETARDQLHKVLQSDDATLLLHALDTVEWIAQVDYIPDILRLIDSENDEVRYRTTQVIRSLWKGRLPTQIYQQLLAIAPAFFEDPIEKIRLEELYLLGHFHRNDTYETLTRALIDESATVREAAITTFANIGTAAVPFLEKLLSEDGSSSSRAATIALCRINPQKYRDELLKYIEVNLKKLYEHKRQSYALLPYTAFASVCIIQDSLYEKIQILLDDIFYLLQSVESDHSQLSVKVLRESLESDKQGLRSDALETLEALTSPQITRLLAPLYNPANTLEDLAKVHVEGITDYPDAFTVLNAYRHENVWIDAAMVYAFAEIASIHPDLSSIALGNDAPPKPFSVISDTLPSIPADLPPTQAMDIKQIMVAIRVSTTSEEALVKAAAQAASRLLLGQSIVALDALESEKAMLSTVERMIILKKVSLFSSISTEQLRVLASICVEKYFRAGEVLFYEGDHSSELYVVVTGDVEVGLYNDDRSEFTKLADYGEGSVFGELTLFQSGTRTASAIAVSDVFILTIQSELLMVMLREYPDLAIEMLKTLSGYLVASNTRISELSPHTTHDG